MHTPPSWPKDIAFAASSENLDAAATQPDVGELLDSSWSERRKLDFCRGRRAAGEALLQLGIVAPPLSPTHHGPRWPDGIVGSLSHTKGVAVAVAARRDAYAGLGVDIERSTRPCRDDLIHRIATREEQEWVNRSESATVRHQRTLKLFIAKEAIWKCLSPLGVAALRFQAVELLPIESGVRCVNIQHTIAQNYTSRLTLLLASDVDLLLALAILRG